MYGMVLGESIGMGGILIICLLLHGKIIDKQRFDEV